MSTCPIPGCNNSKSDAQIMCRVHWFQVPKEIREQVWNEYRSAPKSPEHYAAVRAAFDSVITR